MQIALHSKGIAEATLPVIKGLLKVLLEGQADLLVSQPLYDLLKATPTQLPRLSPFVQKDDLRHADLMISLGGDGTLLEAVNYVSAAEIPVLGMNTGRMGFLATVAPEKAVAALESYWQGNYSIDARTLLQLEVNGAALKHSGCALNEVAFLKQDTSSMIAIHACINGALRTTYWADGLVVATPTGSTGYSLSCGGPIILPSAHNLLITPVSPHNLAVRPLVVPDSAVLTFKLESRNQKFLVALDGRSQAIRTNVALTVKKAPFQAKLVKVGHDNMFDVLRQKLHWGLDVRN